MNPEEPKVPDLKPDIANQDRTILRELAKRVAEIAAEPVMAERRQRWRRHNDLKSTCPIVWVSPEGSWRELLPESAMKCEGKKARGIEASLRRNIYCYEHFHDDAVIEPYWTATKAVRNTGWGMEEKWDYSGDPTGAKGFHPQILEPADLKKLRHPEVIHDEQAGRRNLEQMQELLGDILPVRFKGVAHVSFHLMRIYIGLRGLEQVMLDMYENPGMLHEAMAFLEAGSRRLVEQYVEMDLLSLNNDDTYHSSGGKGYTDELPRADFDGERVRPCDMWASAEAQELAQVSPQMHVEFSMDCEKRLLAPFGRNGYGCCEDLTRKLDDVLTIPNIRRISISPWADVEKCAEKLKGDYIFSWKPHPGMVAGDFDPGRIRHYIRRALQVTKANGCAVEMILKDTHTCEHRPERFTVWTQIAREEVERAFG